MAFGCEVYNIVDIVLCKQLVGQLTVADVAFHEKATLVVDIILNGSQIAGIGECIKNDDLDVSIFVFLVQKVLDEV